MYQDLLDAEIALGGITSSDVVTKIDHWFDNKLNDGFYYYPQKIEREMDSTQLSISFVEEYDGDEFKTKSFGYTLQFAILVDAIQQEIWHPLIIGDCQIHHGEVVGHEKYSKKTILFIFIALFSIVVGSKILNISFPSIAQDQYGTFTDHSYEELPTLTLPEDTYITYTTFRNTIATNSAQINAN